MTLFVFMFITYTLLVQEGETITVTGTSTQEINYLQCMVSNWASVAMQGLHNTYVYTSVI